MIPTTTEQIMITTVELTLLPALDIAKMITLIKNANSVSIVLAKNNIKNR